MKTTQFAVTKHTRMRGRALLYSERERESGLRLKTVLYFKKRKMPALFSVALGNVSGRGGKEKKLFLFFNRAAHLPAATSRGLF